MASPRAAARQALVDWLTAGNIDGLDIVHAAQPLRLDFNQYAGSSDHQCQAVVMIDDEGELRFALGGEHSGKKRIDYMVSLEVYHRTMLPDPVAALDAFDDVIDAIKARLRADRRLGTTEEIVWQAGEGSFGIQTEFQEPDEGQIGGEGIEHYARIRFEITQWITS